MAEPLPTTAPSAAAVPAITMVMTTIIENGQTIVFPLQRVATDLARQSGHSDGWAGLGPGSTATRILPAPGGLGETGSRLRTGTELSRTAVSASGLLVVPGRETVVRPLGAATSVTAAPIPSSLRVTEGAIPPVLSYNDNPSMTASTIVTRTTDHLPTSVPSKAKSTAIPAFTLSSGLSYNATSDPRKPTSTLASSFTYSRSNSTPGPRSASSSLVDHLPSSTRTIWDLGGASSDEIESKTSTASPLITSGMSKQSDGGVVLAEVETTTRPSTSPSQPVSSGFHTAEPASKITALPNLPSPGSPEETKVRALVSSSITLTGAAAVAAIQSGGAIQLDSEGGVSKERGAREGLNEFAIAGMVAGGLIVLIINIVVWVRWRKRRKEKEREEGESQPEMKKRESGFDFTDDPVHTTGMDHHMTRLPFEGGLEDHGPFDDRYRSYHDLDRESCFQPDRLHPTQLPHREEEDGYPFFRNVPDHQLDATSRHDDFCSPTRPDDLDALYDTAMQDEQARRVAKNPFVPAVPALPEGLRRSTASGMLRSAPTTTGMTDVYADYASRPHTQMDRGAGSTRRHETSHERENGERELDNHENYGHDLPAETPSTSSLLPCLKGQFSPPPVPQIRRKADVTQRVNGAYEDEAHVESKASIYTRYESNVAGIGALRGSRPGPARPAMHGPGV